MHPAGVVFDLDGTLVDSRHDLAAAVNAMRGGLGLPALPVAAVTAMVGEGARSLVRRALPEAVTGRSLDAALALFLDLYHERCLEETRPYPGIVDLLASLAPRYPLAVLTNKPERHSRRILDGLGLGPHFDQVVGGDSLPARKPDPAGLRRVARGWGTAADRLLLVGDSGIDAQTAHAAGAALALVTWGYGTAAEMEALDAWVVESPRELLVGLG